MSSISQEIRHLMATGSEIRKMWERGFALKQEHGAENVADMTLGNPLSPPPPELLQALQEVVRTPPEGMHRYTPMAGYPEARERIAEHLNRHGLLPGVTCRQIILTCGAAGASNVFLRSVLDPGDEVIILAPYFPDYPAHVVNHRGVPVIVPTDEAFLPDPAAIEQALSSRTRVLIANHPNNPTGRQYPVALLAQLHDLLRRHNRHQSRPLFLFSDEPYREIRYTDEPFASPARDYEHGVMCYSFSKSMSIPGQRIGYLALNPQGSDRDLETALGLATRILGFANAPSLWQHVVARCLDACRDLSLLRRHRQRLLAALAERGYQVIPPDGGFYLFPRTPGGEKQDDTFVRQAMNRLLLVTPGVTFGQPGHFRMAFCVDERTVDLAIERLPPAG